mmetsp:Transcript_23808/g.54396  ORF Transcript_23808/g.54396 Transcript_23808/m.54396 type:complete len:317 (+) Transcript_23808:539-1489(+)
MSACSWRLRTYCSFCSLFSANVFCIRSISCISFCCLRLAASLCLSVEVASSPQMRATTSQRLSPGGGANAIGWSGRLQMARCTSSSCEPPGPQLHTTVCPAASSEVKKSLVMLFRKFSTSPGSARSALVPTRMMLFHLSLPWNPRSTKLCTTWAPRRILVLVTGKVRMRPSIPPLAAVLSAPSSCDMSSIREMSMSPMPGESKSHIGWPSMGRPAMRKTSLVTPVVFLPNASSSLWEGSRMLLMRVLLPSPHSPTTRRLSGRFWTSKLRAASRSACSCPGSIPRSFASFSPTARASGSWNVMGLSGRLRMMFSSWL